MRTTIPTAQRQQPGIAAAEQILRTCVHCGFCNATCPTYLLTGNELESPRGRIYLMKSVLEGQIEASPRTLGHIDNCLGCLSCETTCPSGVNYGQLLEDGRERLEPLRRRAWFDRLQRYLISRLLPRPRWLRPAVRMGRWLRPVRHLLPTRAGRMLAAVPRPTTSSQVATPGVHPAQGEGETRLRVVLLTGCAQQVLGASINDAAVRLLTRLGVEVTIPAQQTCCGALTHHMGERHQSHQLMTQTIDLWDGLLREGLDAIVLTTSGCQTLVQDYGRIFAGTDYEAAAARVSAATLEVSQVLTRLPWPAAQPIPNWRVAYHDACSMQHGLRLSDPPRQLLQQTGVDPLEIPEGHICCGSAGTYHLLRDELAAQLQLRKSELIRRVAPDVIVAGNVGCLEQLGAALPDIAIVHTVQWLDWSTGGPCPEPLQELASETALSSTDITS